MPSNCARSHHSINRLMRAKINRLSAMRINAKLFILIRHRRRSNRIPVQVTTPHRQLSLNEVSPLPIKWTSSKRKTTMTTRLLPKTTKLSGSIFSASEWPIHLRRLSRLRVQIEFHLLHNGRPLVCHQPVKHWWNRWIRTYACLSSKNWVKMLEVPGRPLAWVSRRYSHLALFSTCFLCFAHRLDLHSAEQLLFATVRRQSVVRMGRTSPTGRHQWIRNRTLAIAGSSVSRWPGDLHVV